MAEGVFRIRLGRPPAEVFALVGDLERVPEWVPDRVSVTKQTPGEVGPGTRYTEVTRTVNATVTSVLEVMEYEPPRSIVVKGNNGPARFVTRVTLEPDEDGTVLTQQYTIRMRGLLRLFEPLVAGYMRRNTNLSLFNLRRALNR